MNCPVDNTELVMTERQGVEIDYCPKCRGVWLDRGELDKIIERSDALENRGTQQVVSSDSVRPAESRPNDLAGLVGDVLDRKMRDRDRSDRDRYDRDRYDRDRDYDYHRHKKKKKGGLLGELFDF